MNGILSSLSSVTLACQRSCSRTSSGAPRIHIWTIFLYPGALRQLNFQTLQLDACPDKTSRLGWPRRVVICIFFQNNSTLSHLDSYPCNIDSAHAPLENVHMEVDFEHVDNDVDMEALYYSCSLAALV
mmetsp:Transcript_39923/g.86062  ORF Transcript_39923/g.86062 Transcript_39923/m.86062 type:complete len:128 (-) Transcript_39923:1265-1648(-)